MPTYQDVMTQLESFGTDQNIKIYRRHGAASPRLFGVSYGNLNKLVKKIKTDHALAQQLWASGNHDARILAMKIADPDQATSAELDSWVNDLGDYILADALSEFISKTTFVQEKAEAWMASSNEWISTTGWNLLGYLALNGQAMPDSYFEPYLQTIESDIHQRQNRVRYAMNNALIQIGSRNGALEPLAIITAKNVGKVDVDHGQTSCKTPDAASYIQKVRAHKQEA